MLGLGGEPHYAGVLDMPASAVCLTSEPHAGLPSEGETLGGSLSYTGESL